MIDYFNYFFNKAKKSLCWSKYLKIKFILYPTFFFTDLFFILTKSQHFPICSHTVYIRNF